MMSRRALLALGGISVLSACATRPSEKRAHRVEAAAPAPVSESPTATPTPTTPPPTGAPTQPQYRIAAGPRVIALTVDDGPDPQWTPELLAVLREHQVQASFFMLGSQAAAHPDLVRAVAADGHELATHTWSHANLRKLGPDAVRRQIERGVEAVASASGGEPPTLFRAPYGAWSPSALAACQQLGQRPFSWSVDPKDWARPGVQHIVDAVLEGTGTGSIILSHDGGGNRSQTVAAMRRCIPRLLAAGYRFAAL